MSSDASSDISSVAPDETLYERVTALKDILPPSQRRFFSKSYDNVSSWLATALSFSGKALWVVSSSGLLLGVPFGLAYMEEQQMLAMEQEMKMTQSTNEVSWLMLRIALGLPTPSLPLVAKLDMDRYLAIEGRASC